MGARTDAPIIYSEDQTAASTIQDRDPGYRPTYLVYADAQRTPEAAGKLVESLGLRQHLLAYRTRVFVTGIDPSRVYLTGLSAGAMNSFVYGLDNISRIAAVEGSSAPFGPPALMEAAAKLKGSGRHLPMYSIAGTHDMYRPLPVNDTARSFYTVIRAFGLVNDVAVPDTPDLKANELFGLAFHAERWGELGGTRAMIGTMSDDQGVVMKFVGLDPYGHWNFKPAAADMWAFLSRFRRDLTTGKLQVTAVH